MIVWFNSVMTLLIGLFTIGVIGEKDKESKQYYQNVLILSIIAFCVFNFFEWSY